MANQHDAVSPPDNDDLSVTITISDPRPIEGSYGGNPFICTITRAGDTSEQQLIYWHAYGSGEHPIGLSELDATIRAFVFAPGETTKTFTMWTIADFAVEPDEGFTLSAFDPTTETDYGTPAYGTIVDDDTKISITALAPALREGSADGQGAEFVFELTRWGDLSGTHILPWAVPGNGMTTASDFIGSAFPQGVVTFAPGETHKTIAIQVAPDAVVESGESFTVELPNMVGVIDGPNWASAGILNDDATVEVRRLEMDVAEGQSGTTAAVFELLLAGDTSQLRSISWKVGPEGPSFPPSFGYSANPADFAGGVFPTGTVTFAPGETRKTFSVPITGDTQSETYESYQVTLFDPSPGLTVGLASSSFAGVRNDDPLPVRTHDDAYVITQGSWVTNGWGRPPGILANDIGAEAVSLAKGPRHGTVQLETDGGFTYKPDAGFTGTDSFTYIAAGPDGYGEGLVTIHVTPVIKGQNTTLNLLALTPEEQVAATYVAFAGRAADAAGFDFWVNEFHAGLPTQGPKALLGNIASSFAISDEAKGLYAFLANPGGASDGEIGVFLGSVYHNLFNREPDEAGLAYWTGQVRQALASNKFVGSVLVDIMSGTQHQPSGLVQNVNFLSVVIGNNDLATLMAKVAVGLGFVRAQQEHGMAWNGPADIAAATDLVKDVYGSPQYVLVGMREAEDYVAAHG